MDWMGKEGREGREEREGREGKRREKEREGREGREGREEKEEKEREEKEEKRREKRRRGGMKVSFFNFNKILIKKKGGSNLKTIIIGSYYRNVILFYFDVILIFLR